MSARKWMRWTRGRWARILVIVSFVVLLAMLALWMTFQHIPSWYRPTPLNREGVRRAQIDSTAMVNWISKKMVAGEPFEIILNEQSVNEWLAALAYSYPEVHRQLPPGVSEPVVRFQDGTVRIGARCARDGFEVILSLAIQLRISEAGDHVVLMLDSIHGGSLPAPRMLILELLEPALQKYRSSRRRASASHNSVLDALRKVPSADALFEGIKIRNRFIWANAKRWFRINSVSLREKELRLTITPL